MLGCTHSIWEALRGWEGEQKDIQGLGGGRGRPQGWCSYCQCFRGQVELHCAPPAESDWPVPVGGVCALAATWPSLTLHGISRNGGT